MKRKPPAFERNPKMHPLQVEVPGDLFLEYKSAVVRKGISIRFDLVSHMRATVGLPPLKPEQLEPARRRKGS